MTKLREAVLLEMRLRGLSPRTNESYVHALEETGIDVALCPFCGKGHLVRTEKPIFPPDTEMLRKPP